MKRLVANVTTKGQVVIPKEMRERLNIKPYSQVVFEEGSDRLIIRPAITTDEAYGMFKDKIKRTGATEEDYKESVSKGVVKKFKRSL